MFLITLTFISFVILFSWLLFGATISNQPGSENSVEDSKKKHPNQLLPPRLDKDCTDDTRVKHGEIVKAYRDSLTKAFIASNEVDLAQKTVVSLLNHAQIAIEKAEIDQHYLSPSEIKEQHKYLTDLIKYICERFNAHKDRYPLEVSKRLKKLRKKIRKIVQNG